MELLVKSKNRKIKQKVQQDHYWYDPISKQMLHGRGGIMVFQYDPQQKRSVPRIIDHEEMVYKNDFDEIKKWVEKNKARMDFEVTEIAPGYSITLEIEAGDFIDITTDLFRNGISFDYDEKELKAGVRK